MMKSLFAKSVCGGGLFFGAVTVDENSLIPLGSAIFVLSGVWYLSSRLQKLDDGQKEICRRLTTLEEKSN